MRHVQPMGGVKGRGVHIGVDPHIHGLVVHLIAPGPALGFWRICLLRLLKVSVYRVPAPATITRAAANGRYLVSSPSSLSRMSVTSPRASHSSSVALHSLVTSRANDLSPLASR